MQPGDSNGWGEWSKHVLKTLERIDTDLRDINKQMRKLEVQIAMLQVKSTVWGAAGAALVVLISKLVSKM